MKLKTLADDEPLHLLVLHGLAYLAATLLFVGWLAPAAAVVAATLGVVGGCFCESHLGARRIQWMVRAAGGLLVLIAGVAASAGVEHFAFISHFCGVRSTLNISFSLSFGLGALGSVVALRSLTHRWPLMALVESAVLIVLAVWPLAAHRDYRLHQPRFLGDWALANGHDPQTILIVLGAVVLGAVGILRLRNQNVRQTTASVLMLLVCGLFVVVGSEIYPWPTHVVDRPHVPDPGPLPRPNPDDPDDDYRLGLSFDEHDWEQTPRPLAIVTLHEDCSPPVFGGGYYFRSNAYSDFLNNRFWQAKDKQVDADVPRDFASQSTLIPDVPARPDDRLVPMTISLIERQNAPLGLVPTIRFEPSENVDPRRFERTYHAVSRASPRAAELFQLKLGDPQWTDAQQRYYLQGSPDPRYAELAAQIVAKIDRGAVREDLKNSPLVDALAIRRWVAENCTYSLHPSKPKTADPTSEFLFGDRRGFCVHAAQCMALLLRSRGIPARLAGGFLVPEERRGRGSAMLLQANDGHCWCEVRLDGAGWIPFDVSLQKSEEPTQLGVDPGLQHYYSELNRKRSHLGQLAIGLYLPMLFVAVSLSVMLALYLIKAWRRLVPRWAVESHLYRVCYRAVLDSLSDAGLRRQFGESREDFARRIAKLVPEFAALSEAHLHQWLSDRPVLARANWLQLQRSSQARLLVAIPRARRVMVWLNPAGWLFTR